MFVYFNILFPKFIFCMYFSLVSTNSHELINCTPLFYGVKFPKKPKVFLKTFPWQHLATFSNGTYQWQFFPPVANAAELSASAPAPSRAPSPAPAPAPAWVEKLWHSNDKWNRMGSPRNAPFPRKRMWARACQSTYFTIFIA